MYSSLKKKRERERGNQRKTIFYIHFYLNRIQKTMENTNSRFGRYLPLYRPSIKIIDFESQFLIFAIRNGSLGKPDSNDSVQNFETSATTYRLRSEMQQPFRGNLLIGPRACSFASHAFTSISIDFLKPNCFSVVTRSILCCSDSTVTLDQTQWTPRMPISSVASMERRFTCRSMRRSWVALVLQSRA